MSGLTSRWTIPFRCSAVSAPQMTALDLRFQRVAAQIFHNDIGRAIFLKVFPYLHDVRNGLELDHVPRLVQKARIALSEFLRPFSRVENDLLAAGNAVGDAGGEILLQRDCARELLVIGAVCNAKAAEADHGLDTVTPGDLPARLQGVRQLCGLRIAAVRAGGGSVRDRSAAFFTAFHLGSLWHLKVGIPVERFSAQRDEQKRRYAMVTDSILLPLGLQNEHRGTEFLRLLVCMRIFGVEADLKRMYEYVAMYYHSTPAAVERAIRYSIECAWEGGNLYMQFELFGNTTDSAKGKPTNAEFIATVVQHIRNRLRHGSAAPKAFPMYEHDEQCLNSAFFCRRNSPLF